ncbi:hypothetical protein [Lactiplantibacillus mudanjiangensis]|uniref:Uncharacterized protein n=1 Tax=Lactiplantibacillus mudanjiangensis TaxID=1296538 RepID=A0A660DYH4_9LACO|nr:hypothetical protein [Lactiplantibacillus mudanjiangensis]VDG25946.1 hypothetical protein [Lactobacillus sp. CBA3605] [Lactiplantibacillus mudanjiangensis]VDG28830.1 hypothetical protein [Lactobacillus sp. CBA3605] [Lactiplantibacillus mudanjiangensis]
MPTIQSLYDPNRPTLLLSLHPENTQAILTQTKRFEYRRRFYQDAFQAFVYTTGPNGGVDLFIQCETPIRGTADELAQLEQADPESLRQYFAGLESGLAIPISKVVELPKLSLATLKTRFSNFVAPRSYVFLDRPARQAQFAYFFQQPVSRMVVNEKKPR